VSLIASVRARAADAQHRTDEVLHGGGFSSELLDDTEINKAERQLGLRLPSTLRAVYREIGNGGFGPGYGLLPLRLDPSLDEHETVVDLYSAFTSSDPKDPAWRWPDQLVPFCDWGCAIRSCVDCVSSDGKVVTFDPNARQPGQDLSASFAATHPSIDAWFRDWVSGVKIWALMFETDPDKSREITNPFTRKSISVAPMKLRRPLGQ
jgi:hypothetical protein